MSCRKTMISVSNAGWDLGLAGGVALDNGDCIVWHCSVSEANRVLARLRDRLGDEGHGSNCSETKQAFMPQLLISKHNDSGGVTGIDLGSTRIKVVIYNGSSGAVALTGLNGK